MNSAEQMALKDFKNRLSMVVDKVEREHDRVVITKHGRPAAIVLSVDDLESLEETIDVLSSPGLLEQIREGLVELGAGSSTAMSKDDALSMIRSA